MILAAYLKWGISCVERLNGMFAIALYDRRKQTVYLIRDRIGKKPLYYWLDGENLVFASELKPIMDCPGFSGRIRREVLPRFLYQQYINAPDTIFENVYKLEPGGILRFVWIRTRPMRRTPRNTRRMSAGRSGGTAAGCAGGNTGISKRCTGNACQSP